MIAAMKRVPGKRRSALAGDDQHETLALHAAAGNEIQKSDAGLLEIYAVQIKPAFNLHVAAGQLLFGAPVKAGNRRRRLVE
jgi:hypothetical protein